MPKRPEYEARKTYTLKVRVTKEEYDDIMRIAADKNLSVSDVMRSFYRGMRILFSEKLTFADMIIKLPDMEAIIHGRR